MDYTNHPGFIAFGAAPAPVADTEKGKEETESSEETKKAEE